MLPYEPLIKTIHSKVKCYTRKTKKKIKSGETHSYSSKQFIIPLKNDQPFSCEEEVSVLKSEDFFRMNNLLNQRRSDYEEQLQRIISLEQELNILKNKLKYYNDLEVDIKLLKLKRLERELFELEEKSKKQEEKINDLKKRLEKDEIINKGSGVLGKLSDLFINKNDKNP